MTDHHTTDHANLDDIDDLEPETPPLGASLTDPDDTEQAARNLPAEAGVYDTWGGIWERREANLARWGAKHSIWWAPTPVLGSSPSSSSYILAANYLHRRAREHDLPLHNSLNTAATIALRAGRSVNLPDWVAGAAGLPLHAMRLALGDLADRMDVDSADPIGADLVREVMAAQWSANGVRPTRHGQRQINASIGLGLRLSRHITTHYRTGRVPQLLEHTVRLATINSSLYPRMVYKILRTAVTA